MSPPTDLNYCLNDVVISWLFLKTASAHHGVVAIFEHYFKTQTVLRFFITKGGLLKIANKLINC